MKYFTKFTFTVLAIITLSAIAFGQSTGGVKGRVRSSSGDGLAEVTITLKQKNEDIKTVTTNDKGEFLLDGLAFGKYTLVFTKDGYNTGKMTVEISKKKIIDLGGRLTLNSDQGTQVIVKGSVFNQDGVSIFGAEVKIEKILSDGSTKKVGSGFTSVGGEFTFRFPEGAAKFRVTSTAKGVSGSKEISVDSAGYYRLAISLNLPK